MFNYLFLLLPSNTKNSHLSWFQYIPLFQRVKKRQIEVRRWWFYSFFSLLLQGVSSGVWFCPTYKLLFHGYSQKTWDSRVRDKGPCYNTADSMSISIFAPVLRYPQVSRGDAEGLDVCLHMRWVALQEWNSKPGEPSFVTSREQFCSLSWRGVLLHPSRLLTANTALWNSLGRVGRVSHAQHTQQDV